MERRGLASATVRRKLSALSSLFDYLCERNAVTGNPVDGTTSFLKFFFLGGKLRLDCLGDRPEPGKKFRLVFVDRHADWNGQLSACATFGSLLNQISTALTSSRL
jgi:hypothetical protein